MTPHDIVALRCPSCGGGASQPSRTMPFGAEFSCEHCGITSVLVIDRALVPLSTLQQQGEKVCVTCGRVALREARFCQEGHVLVRTCIFCRHEFAVDHQRCDSCGKLQDRPVLNEVYQGTVVRITDFGAFVDLFDGLPGLLHISEVADHRVKDIRNELKEGEEILVKVINIDTDGKMRLSRKGLGRP